MAWEHRRTGRAGQQATVVPARLFLFDRPGASSTKRYLVQGDRVECSMNRTAG